MVPRLQINHACSWNKSSPTIKGVAVFIIIRILSEIIGLHTLSWLMNQVIMYGVIAAVVIFNQKCEEAGNI